jgi:hypothetical protein
MRAVAVHQNFNISLLSEKQINGLLWSQPLGRPVKSDVAIDFSQNDKSAANEPFASIRPTVINATNNMAQDFIDEIYDMIPKSSEATDPSPVFNEKTYIKAKPLFKRIVTISDSKNMNIEKIMRALIKLMMKKHGAALVIKMKPYLLRFISESRAEDSD